MEKEQINLLIVNIVNLGFQNFSFHNKIVRPVSESPEKSKIVEDIPLSESKILYDFNPVVDTTDIDMTNNYPTLRSILDKKQENPDFNFKFDDNQQNNADNLPWNNNLDFNFDK